MVVALAVPSGPTKRAASRTRRTTKKWTRIVAAVATCLATTFSYVGIAPAQDPQSAAADLAHASDFRVRVSAALLLGKTKPDGARLMLERALDDAHPAVRTAAAAALAALGDRTAVSALERHAQDESSGAARAQMKASAASLLHPRIDAPASHGHARYAVAIGHMRNVSGIRGDDLANVLHDAARAQAESLPGAMVIEGDGSSGVSDRMPVLLLDGQLTRLSQSSSSGATRIEARVEFSIRRVPQQVLKGTLSGGATAVEPARAVNGARLVELQNETVGSAVESALSGAGSGLALAAK
ncbi:MAG TPA: HEAT repeat domain-containing protein [Polyangiaceae bacterium]|jgi:hypothetical protein